MNVESCFYRAVLMWRFLDLWSRSFKLRSMVHLILIKIMSLSWLSVFKIIPKYYDTCYLVSLSDKTIANNRPSVLVTEVTASWQLGAASSGSWWWCVWTWGWDNLARAPPPSRHPAPVPSPLPTIANANSRLVNKIEIHSICTNI